MENWPRRSVETLGLASRGYESIIALLDKPCQVFSLQKPFASHKLVQSMKRMEGIVS